MKLLSLLFILSISISTVFADGLSPMPLNEVLPQADVIVVAEISSNDLTIVEKTPKKGFASVTYTCKIKAKVLEKVKGNSPSKLDLTFSYTVVKGRWVTWEGSGLEQHMKAKEKYVLLLTAKGDKLELLRAEKVIELKNIKKFLKEKKKEVKKEVKKKMTLHYAARYMNHYNELKLLIEKGANVNLVDSNGDSPLYINLLYGSFTKDSSDYKERFKKASLLIKNGAKVNVKGSALPLIFYAVNNYEMLKLLVDSGANVNEKNNFKHLTSRGNDTPLHWASQYGTLKTVKYLLKKGAVIDAKDDSGWLPIHCAIFGGNTEIVKFYLSKKMDKTIKTTKEFEVLWGGWAENPYPANSSLLEIAKIAQSNAHRYNKKASDYDEIINLLKK